MRRSILPLTLAGLGLAAAGWLFWGAFSGQREDVATARAFLTHLGQQDFDPARGMMSPLLAALLEEGALERSFGQIEAWESLSFGQRSSNSNGGTRETEMWGLGTTVSGCESELYMRVDGGLIEAINIAPLCPRTGEDG